VKLYLFQGIGVFLICVFLYPRSRFIGAIVFAAGFVAVDLIAQVIRVRRLQRRKLQEVEGHPNHVP
jgi:hypothetical protein